MCPLLKAFETRGARDQTTKVRRRAFSLLTIMSRAQRQRARTEMWQSNYGTETRGRPRVRRVRGYRCVVVERRLPRHFGFHWSASPFTESGIRPRKAVYDGTIVSASMTLRSGSSGRGRPVGTNLPSGDLGGICSVEPQASREEGLDSTRSRPLSTHPQGTPSGSSGISYDLRRRLPV